MKIMVLGGYGTIGKVVVTDLVGSFNGEIVVAGRDIQKANQFATKFGNKRVGAEQIDVKDTGLAAAIKDADVLINATNYYFNVSVMRAALSAGVHYIDLGGLYHTTKQQLKLDGAFRKKGLLAIAGCGSTPGITNIIASHITSMLDRVDALHIQFADKDYTSYTLPFVVPYTMETVFDELVKQPVVFENGRYRFVQPMSGNISIKFPSPVNNATCFYTLHSELATLPAWLKHKGIKSCSFRAGFDPEFIAKLKFLIDTGFADANPRKEFNGISPRQLSVKLLDRFIPYNQKIDDLEFLRVEATGRSKGRRKTIIGYCKAVTNKEYNIPAGTWDTGVPASIAAQMIIDCTISRTGVMAPESCINPELFFALLKKRGISIYVKSD